jgi:probable rRNA maturation factor
MVVNRQRRVRIAVDSLSDFLETTRAALQFPKGSVGVQFVSDSAMATLNLKFRNKKGPTDVLSFPAEDNGSLTGRAARKNSSPLPDDGSYIGDIAIAPATAQRNALEYSRSLDEELRILILHGMIHLAGYDHEVDDGQMNRLERQLRRRFGLSLS